MVKGWADHCSSDEEEVLSDREPQPLPGKRDEEDEVAATEQHGPPPPRTYAFPTEPPYTAYCGRLHFDLTAEDLAANLIQLAKNKLDLDLTVLEAKIMRERTHGQPFPQSSSGQLPPSRGFGYVTVETLEMLQALMQLNEVPDATIFDRHVQLDAAAHNPINKGGGGRSSNQNRPSNVDGTQFRGGKYANYHKNDHSQHRGGGGGGSGGGNSSYPRFGPGERQHRDGNDGAPAASNPASPPGALDDGPTPQRPSLKLKPRSKPLEEKDAGGGSQSDIFGGAKPRNEGDFAEPRRRNTKSGADGGKVANDDAAAAPQPRHSATETVDGRHAAGRGDNSGGRGGGRGRGGSVGRGNAGRAGGGADGGGSNHDRRPHTGRTGSGGRGRGGASGGQHSEKSNARGNKQERKTVVSTDSFKTSEHKKRTTTNAPAPAPAKIPDKPAEAKVTNKFAALDFGSDSD